MLEWIGELFLPARHGDRVRAVLRGQPVVAIADVADGARACIAGRVEAVRTQFAPMTNAPCAAWFLSIEETGAADHRFAGSLVSHGELLVRDDTGSALVTLEGARFAWPSSRTSFWPSGVRARAQWTPTERDAFERAGVRLNHPLGSGVRFHEHALVPGSLVLVYGHAQREPDRALVDADTLGYRGDAPTRPVFSGARKIPIYLADTGRHRTIARR